MITVNSKVYMGKVFRGNKVASVLPLPGVVMGRLSNGRPFILADRDLTKVTVR